MADGSALKTNWDNPVFSNVADLGGQLPTERGTDPLVDLSGSSALQTFYDNAVIAPAEVDGQETPNSLSGLPLQPQRFQPTETPPPNPALNDRSPGVIDEQ